MASERLTGGGRRPIADGGASAGVTPTEGRRRSRRRVPAMLVATVLLVVAVLLGVGVGTIGLPPAVSSPPSSTTWVCTSARPCKGSRSAS